MDALTCVAYIIIIVIIINDDDHHWAIWPQEIVISGNPLPFH
jgi:hypothetical protein